MDAVRRFSALVVLAALVLPLLGEPISLPLAFAQEGSPVADLTGDSDEDGIDDETDNCFDTPNFDQVDSNGNGVGDACDPDTDGDGIDDDQDACPGDPANTCNLPPDSDLDGIPDDQDQCPDDATNACNWPPDDDRDATPNDLEECISDLATTCDLASEPTEQPTATETPAEPATPIAPVKAAAGLVSIGDRVWFDTNKNGIQDSGEPGAPGVTVELDPRAYDLPSATTVTDDNGYYAFTDLPPSSFYTLRFTKLPGYIWTRYGMAYDAGLDSDVFSSGVTGLISTPATGSNLSGPGETDDPTLDAGLRTGISIGDRVWYDTNKNGIQDSGEPGAPGITVTLTQYGTFAAPEARVTTTDNDGYYAFTDAMPSAQQTRDALRFDKPPGYLWTTPAQANHDGTDSVVDQSGVVEFFVGTEGNNQSGPGQTDLSYLDAGLVEIGLVSVGDRVWYDTNKNGVQEQGEPGAPGITIALLDYLSGTPLNTTTTDLDGYYAFTDLPPSKIFQLQFSAPAGYAWTRKGAPGGAGVDSNADDMGRTTFTSPISGSNLAGPGQTDDATLDAGLRTGVSIGDRVWLDIDQDGLQDSAEPGVSGVAIHLLDTYDNPVGSTTTNSDGYYAFNGLQPSTNYALQFDLPNGFVWTSRSQAGGNGTDSRVSQTGHTPLFSPSDGNNLTAPGQTDDSALDAGLIALETSTVTSTGTTSPTTTNTATTTSTASPTSTATATSTPSTTPTVTSTLANTSTQTSTQTGTPTYTPTPSPTRTDTPTSTNSPSSTATNTATKTKTPTRTATATFTAMPTFTPNGFALGDWVKTTTRLNLRRGPGTGNEVIAVLPKSTQCQVTGSASTAGSHDWYPVDCAGFESGFVTGSYLAATAPPSPSASATATRTPSHTATATSTTAILPTGTATSSRTSTPSRTPTQTPTGSSTSTVTRTSTPSKTAPIEQTELSTVESGDFGPGAWVKTTARLNLRSGPGISNPRILVLPKRAVCQISGLPRRVRGTDWYPVVCPDFNSGFVSGNYLTSSAPPAATAVPTGTPTLISGGFAPGDRVRTSVRLNLRRGPSTNRSVLAVLPTNTRCQVTGFAIIAGGRVWYPVTCSRYGSGYVAGSYLEP